MAKQEITYYKQSSVIMLLNFVFVGVVLLASLSASSSAAVAATVTVTAATVESASTFPTLSKSAPVQGYDDSVIDQQLSSIDKQVVARVEAVYAEYSWLIWQRRIVVQLLFSPLTDSPAGSTQSLPNSQTRLSQTNGMPTVDVLQSMLSVVLIEQSSGHIIPLTVDSNTNSDDIQYLYKYDTEHNRIYVTLKLKLPLSYSTPASQSFRPKQSLIQVITTMGEHRINSYNLVISHDWDHSVTFVYFICCVSAYSLALWYDVFASRFTTPKTRAWILTLHSALVLSCVGIVTLVQGLQLSTTWSNSIIIPPAFIWSDTPVSRFASLYFVVYAMMDLIIGYVDYRLQVQLLSGYVHHILYSLLGLYLNWRSGSNAWAVMLILEVPSILLSRGHINPAWRSDWGFGLLFFLTRVVFHGYMLTVIYPGELAVSQLGTIYTGTYVAFGAGVLAWILHMHWFSAWIRGQWKRLRKPD
jgi:hypothetical protein